MKEKPDLDPCPPVVDTDVPKSKNHNYLKVIRFKGISIPKDPLYLVPIQLVLEDKDALLGERLFCDIPLWDYCDWVSSQRLATVLNVLNTPMISVSAAPEKEKKEEKKPEERKTVKEQKPLIIKQLEGIIGDNKEADNAGPRGTIAKDGTVPRGTIAKNGATPAPGGTVGDNKGTVKPGTVKEAIIPATKDEEIDIEKLLEMANKKKEDSDDELIPTNINRDWINFRFEGQENLDCTGADKKEELAWRNEKIKELQDKIKALKDDPKADPAQKILYV